MATTEPNAFAKVVAQSWSDKEFKQRLVDDPHAALAEHGIDVPSGMNINVVENTSDTVHIVLPAEPDGEISEDDLANVSGGGLNPMGGNIFTPTIPTPQPSIPS
jgi:hypothetical protein